MIDEKISPARREAIWQVLLAALAMRDEGYADHTPLEIALAVYDKAVLAENAPDPAQPALPIPAPKPVGFFITDPGPAGPRYSIIHDDSLPGWLGSREAKARGVKAIGISEAEIAMGLDALIRKYGEGQSHGG